MSTNITAIVNQKGGVGKTTTCINLGVGLARQGKKVLLIDFDPQGSLSISLGYTRPDQIPVTITNLLEKVRQGQEFSPQEGILHHEEGIDLLPANSTLSSFATSLVTTPKRESILRRYLHEEKKGYDQILIDCGPTLDMLTINAFAAADQVMIPMQAEYLAVRGFENLVRSVTQVRKNINPGLKIAGVVLTMVQENTNDAKQIITAVREQYGKQLPIFHAHIPRSIRATETTSRGISIFSHDPKGKVVAAYENLTKEVLTLERQRHQSDPCR